MTSHTAYADIFSWKEFVGRAEHRYEPERRKKLLRITLIFGRIIMKENVRPKILVGPKRLKIKLGLQQNGLTLFSQYITQI